MQARSTKTSVFDLQKSNVKSAAKLPKTWAQGLKRYLRACCLPLQFLQKTGNIQVFCNDSIVNKKRKKHMIIRQKFFVEKHAIYEVAYKFQPWKMC